MKRTTIIGVVLLLSTFMCGSVAAEMEDVSGALLKKICTSYVDRPASTSDGM